jgi:hypothetical protein
MNIQNGDKIVFGRCKANKSLVDLTVGKIYEVFASDEHEHLVLKDDLGDNRIILDDEPLAGKATKIIK